MRQPSPTVLSVDPEALAGFAHRMRSRGDRIHEHATGEQLGATSLVPTFGLVGAGFLAAWNRAAHRRANALLTVIADHHEISSATADAARRYLDTDGAAGAAITHSGVVGPEERR